MRYSAVVKLLPHASPLVLLALLLSSASDPGSTARAADWPSWRGPLGTGEAPDANPPISWSETENVMWKTPLPGHGKSTPIVVGDKIFVQAALPLREATAEELAARPKSEDARTEPTKEVYGFLVLALDRKSGEVVWETTVTERLPVGGTHDTNGYASYSPVANGDSVFASFGSYGLYALDAATGKVRWTHELGPQRMRRGFGEGGSPGLHGDALIVVADQEDQSFIEVLDAKSGKVRWRKDRDEPSTWTAPLVVEAAGKTQVVVNGTNAARSYDLANGDVLWQCSGQTANAIPTPVTDGEIVVCTSGFRGAACMALPLDGKGDLQGSVIWNHTDGTPYVPSPALADGRLYFLAGNTGRLSSLDFYSGEVLVDRLHLELGGVYASPVVASGRVYVVGREGTTIVVEHGDEAKIVATNVLDDPIDASPAIVGDTIYLRSEGHLYAIREG